MISNLGGNSGKLSLLQLDQLRLNRRKVKRRKKETMNKGWKKSGSTLANSILVTPEQMRPIFQSLDSYAYTADSFFIAMDEHYFVEMRVCDKLHRRRNQMPQGRSNMDTDTYVVSLSHFFLDYIELNT